MPRKAKDMRDGVFSVSQINEYIKLILDSNPVVSDVWIRGEISNFKNQYSTGHLYFSLKDKDGIIRAVMFRGNAAKLDFVPSDGASVLVHGKISSYVARGEYQIYVDKMQPDGIGNLAAEFERLKARLSAEGLFSVDRKKPIPTLPRRVGVITSASGAAIHDILSVSGRRCPSCEIVIYPAIVQGADAPRSLVGGIKYFNSESAVDVIIIGRGGGSIEDLWGFNSEELARVIADSSIPVVSAVGHETDFTICDFASDLRAPAPSAAAEMVFPDMMQYKRRLEYLSHMSDIRMRRRLDNLRMSIDAASAHLSRLSPERVLNDKMMRVSSLADKLDMLAVGRLERSRGGFALALARLEAANPLSILSRGYAMVERNGQIIDSVSNLSDGDEINIAFADGKTSAVVKGKL